VTTVDRDHWFLAVETGGRLALGWREEVIIRTRHGVKSSETKANHCESSEEELDK
jgi:hypothetical protein